MKRFAAVLTAMGLAGLSGCSGNGVVPGSSGPHGLPLPTVQVDAAGNYAARQIALAANRFIAYHGTENSTRDIYAAPGERACVATVQRILSDAGLPFVGKLQRDGLPIVDVDAFRKALASDKKTWRRLTEKQMARYAGAGDLWIQGDGHPGGNAGQNHIGICQDHGCAHVVSNSSADGAFTWSSTPLGYAAYYAAKGYPYFPGAVYHHR